MAAEVIALLHGLLSAPETHTAQSWSEAVQRVRKQEAFFSRKNSLYFVRSLGVMRKCIGIFIFWIEIWVEIDVLKWFWCRCSITPWVACPFCWPLSTACPLLDVTTASSCGCPKWPMLLFVPSVASQRCSNQAVKSKLVYITGECVGFHVNYKFLFISCSFYKYLTYTCT